MLPFLLIASFRSKIHRLHYCHAHFSTFTSSTLCHSSKSLSYDINKPYCPTTPSWKDTVEFVCAADGRLRDVLQKQANVDKESAELLIQLGAIHVRKLRNGRTMLPWSRRIEDGMVRNGSVIRVYLHPRRFLSCYVCWKDRILWQDEKFLVVEKPAWLPFQPTIDNFSECVINCARQATTPRANGQPMKLFGLHRLDSCTSGALALAKTKDAAEEFHQILRESGPDICQVERLEKSYLTLTRSPVPLGSFTHWMCPERIAELFIPSSLVSNCRPQMLFGREMDSSKKCTLEILSCRRILLHRSTIVEYCKLFMGDGKNASSASALITSLPGDVEVYESRVRLVTGRRHQIRCQLSALGAPLVGDTLYEPMAGILLDRACPHLTTLAMRPLLQEGVTPELSAPSAAERDELVSLVRRASPPVPTGQAGGVGLHAQSLQFLGRRAEAGPPWWQCNS
jgi:23S rRNA-/tRNA-specific pseudouridylate synthase